MMGTEGRCLVKGQRVVETDQKLEAPEAPPRTRSPGEGGIAGLEVRGEVIKECTTQTDSQQ